MKRGDLVYMIGDPRHVGRIEQIAWKDFKRSGLVRVRWLESNWLTFCSVRDLVIITGEPQESAS